MKTLIRIQHNNGKGLFRALDTKGECILESLHCYEALTYKHWEFPSPLEDNLLNGISKKEFCAFKSIEQVKQWIEPEWFNEIIKAGFKVLLLDVSDCREGEYQILYKKEDVLQTKDIPELFRSLA